MHEQLIEYDPAMEDEDVQAFEKANDLPAKPQFTRHVMVGEQAPNIGRFRRKEVQVRQEGRHRVTLTSVPNQHIGWSS